jgi:thiosulfate/3-mercaptopyruvate sulfurtransferase
MKKKILSILFCTMLTTFTVLGCSSKEEKKDTKKQDTKPAAEQTSKVEAEAVDTKQVYVTPEWVQSVIDGNQDESDNYVILECSWGTEKDSPVYGEAHIPGAYHMNTDNIEEDQYWNIRSGEEIEKVLTDFGITKDTTVICYGDIGTNSADDRVAFTALWAGVGNVKCLDGGMEAWTKAGYDTEDGSNEPKTAKEAFGVEIPAHPEYILTIDQVKDKQENDEKFKLVSIRSKDEFLGKTSGYSYIDKAGEPKGAIWGHDTDDGSYLDKNGNTVGTDVLKNYLSESGASLDDDLAFYCGTGWRATIPFLIMYQEGYTNMSLYDGGWFVWQMEDSNSVQVGDPASDNVEYTTVGGLSNDKAAK